MHVKFRLILLSFFFLSLFAVPISSIGDCYAQCEFLFDSCACPGGCTGEATPICFSHQEYGDCNVRTPTWSCGIGNYYIPEFAPIPGFLTFLGSLGIPYWLYRKRKK